MKISDNGSVKGNLGSYLKGIENKKSETGSQKSDDVEKGKTKSDQVQLSSKGKDIHKAKEAIDAIPDVRTDKVETVKKSVENGTYNVNGKMVAEKIIKDTVLDRLL